MDNMENFQKIETDVKKLLENVDKVKSAVDLFSVLIDEKMKMVSV